MHSDWLWFLVLTLPSLLSLQLLFLNTSWSVSSLPPACLAIICFSSLLRTSQCPVQLSASCSMFSACLPRSQDQDICNKKPRYICANRLSWLCPLSPFWGLKIIFALEAINQHKHFLQSCYLLEVLAHAFFFNLMLQWRQIIFHIISEDLLMSYLSWYPNVHPSIQFLLLIRGCVAKAAV